MRWTLIHKYLSEQCTKAEQKKIERWMNKNPDHQIFMESAEKIWKVSPKEESKVDVEAAWRQFHADRMEPSNTYHIAEVKQSSAFRKHTSKPGQAWYKRRSFFAAAAAIALLVVSIFVIQTQQNEPVPVTYQKIVTSAGEKAQIILTDGSKVKLNAESILKIPSDYGKRSRTVYLKGEAFFVVEYNANRPFLVHTEGLVLKDLGTRFNIKAYNEDKATKVVVVEGKVKLGSIGQEKEAPTYLTAYERAVVSEDGKTVIEKIDNLSRYIGWTQDKLVFKDTPFSKVIKKLERWYGVECDVSNKALLEQHLTATFIDEPLPNVLLLIKKAMNIEVEREKKHIKFISKTKDLETEILSE